jgi:hypothetical protein
MRRRPEINVVQEPTGLASGPALGAGLGTSLGRSFQGTRRSLPRSYRSSSDSIMPLVAKSA